MTHLLCCILQDIVDDIQQECSSYGTVLSVIVPRPGEADASRAVGELAMYRDKSVFALAPCICWAR